MFTLDHIKEAHSKVKSGADFPAYVQDIKALGVTRYSTYVTDGHTEYTGANGESIKSNSKYAAMVVDDEGNAQTFALQLKEHQQGKTDFPTFCEQAADAGVEKWVVDVNAMTCTYYDRRDNVMLTEAIPGA